MSAVKIGTDIEPMVVEWERLARHTKANPFLWPGWIRAWWRAFGTGQLQIITTYENGHLTGVLPLRQSHGTLSSPTNYHTPWFGFLAANERAVKQLLRVLLSQRPVHGRPAAKRAKNLASSILGERGNRSLKSGEAMVRARVGQ